MSSLTAVHGVKNSEQEVKDEGTISTIREGSQPYLAFSSIWGDWLTEQVGRY